VSSTVSPLRLPTAQPQVLASTAALTGGAFLLPAAAAASSSAAAASFSSASSVLKINNHRVHKETTKFTKSMYVSLMSNV
jgi:hypothetical protein